MKGFGLERVDFLRLVACLFLLSSVFLLAGNSLTASESDCSSYRTPAWELFKQEREASDLDVLLTGAAELNSGEIRAELEKLCPEALGDVKNIFHQVELCGHFPVASMGSDEAQSGIKADRQIDVRAYQKFFDSDINRIRNDPPLLQKPVRRTEDLVSLDRVLNRLYATVLDKYRKYEALMVSACGHRQPFKMTTRSSERVSELSSLRRQLVALCGESALTRVDLSLSGREAAIKRSLFNFNLDRLWRGAIKTAPELLRIDDYCKDSSAGSFSLFEVISPGGVFPRERYRVRYLVPRQGGSAAELPTGWTDSPGFPVPGSSEMALPVYRRSLQGNEFGQIVSSDREVLDFARRSGCKLKPSEVIFMCNIVDATANDLSKTFSEYMALGRKYEPDKSIARSQLRAKLECLCGADALLEVERNLGY